MQAPFQKYSGIARGGKALGFTGNLPACSVKVAPIVPFRAFQGGTNKTVACLHFSPTACNGSEWEGPFAC